MKLTRIEGMKIYINPDVVRHAHEINAHSESGEIYSGTSIVIRDDISYVSSTPRGEISFVVRENIDRVVELIENARNLRFRVPVRQKSPNENTSGDKK